jgi:RNA polymerase sigma factor (TIGR02999 family)
MKEPSLSAKPGALTELLHRWNDGDRIAANEVARLVYGELRRIAAAYARRERPDHTLSATAIVHEAYLRIFNRDEVHWQDRAHFMGAAARVMRQILTDYARHRNRVKRRVFRDADAPPAARLSLGTLAPEDLVAIDDSLTRLARIDPRKARVVEAHFYGGMTVDETAAYLGVSHTTVARELKLAKGWIHQQLAPRKHAD